MEDNLKVIMEKYQRTDCPLISIMQSMMSFFQYDAKGTWYYMIGNGCILSLPFKSSREKIFNSIFHYMKEVCYFSGAYYFDFLTEDTQGFVDKLEEKWFEWADMFQAMPIIVALLERGHDEPGIYILSGVDREQELFELINGDGKSEIILKKDISSRYDHMGFATIDVPYNFMVKSTYYRKPETVYKNISKRIRAFFQNETETMEQFKILSEESLSTEQENRKKEILERIYSLISSGWIPADLFRKAVGNALTEAGNEIVSCQYKELGMMWKTFWAAYQTGASDVNVNISRIARKELELIEMERIEP